MPDSVKCACPQCGAKYRLPIETQGRSVRCKRCDNKFRVPATQTTVEDSVLSWLADGGREEAETDLKPRVIQMETEKPATPAPAAPSANGVARQFAPSKF